MTVKRSSALVGWRSWPSASRADLEAVIACAMAAWDNLATAVCEAALARGP